MSFLGIFTGANQRERERQIALASRYAGRMDVYRNQGGGITGASKSPASNWNGIVTTDGDDSLNREYLINLAAVQSRAQDIDVNNPDVKGFHRTRTGQVIGKGVKFRHASHSDEVGMETGAMTTLSQKINRVRDVHSRLGGFDAQGLNRSEQKQQERVFLTALVLGSCLIHRVWRRDRRYPIPLSIELIPGSRISTPYNRMGDPKINYGVEYTDDHRTRVVGWHVRRVSRTVGNSFSPDFTWDFISVEDGSLSSLTEIAGIDRALPLSTANISMLRNRGEFVENTVKSARAAATTYMVNKVGKGESKYNLAADDAAEGLSRGLPSGFMPMGDAQAMYISNDEAVEFTAATLPAPDFVGFMDCTDERLARGFAASKSAFTRTVNSSYAGGRLEQQLDVPLIGQYRDSFVSAWNRVNDWFIDACYLSGVVDMPGFSENTRAFWCEFHAHFPGELHINPQDTGKARAIGFGLRTVTPQQACEEDGLEFVENARQWGRAIQTLRNTEKEFGLEDGTLEILLPEKTVTTSAGEAVNGGMPATEPSAQDDLVQARQKNRSNAALNRMGASRG